MSVEAGEGARLPAAEAALRERLEQLVVTCGEYRDRYARRQLAPVERGPAVSLIAEISAAAAAVEASWDDLIESADPGAQNLNGAYGTAAPILEVVRIIDLGLRCVYHLEVALDECEDYLGQSDRIDDQTCHVARSHARAISQVRRRIDRQQGSISEQAALLDLKSQVALTQTQTELTQTVKTLTVVLLWFTVVAALAAVLAVGMQVVAELRPRPGTETTAPQSG